MGEKYARMAGLDSDEDIRAFRLGAIVAGDENKYDTIEGLTPGEVEILDREVTHKWSSKTPKLPPYPLSLLTPESRSEDALLGSCW